MSADLREGQAPGTPFSSKPGCPTPAGLPRVIVERKRLQSAADENLAKFQAVFDGVETGIFIIDPETHIIVDANPVAAQLVGAPLDRIVGAVCHKFVCPADKGRCPVTDLGQTVDNSERVLLTVNGEKRSIIKTVKPVEMEGRPCLLESFLDITQRKRSEKALEERTAYLDTLIETSPLGIVVLDKDERVQLSNTAFEKLFLYSREEMQGARLSGLIIPAGLVSEGDRFTRECLNGRSIRFTSCRRRKNNALVDVEVYGVPLMIGGQLQGLLALYRDVSERTRIEAEMAERHHLAALAAEIGLALTGADGLSQGLQECVDTLLRNMDIVFAQIWTTNEKDHRLELRASADIQLLSGPSRKRMDPARIERIAESGVMQLDGAAGPDPSPAPAAAGQPATYTFVGYPLKVREQVLGVAAAFVSLPLTDATIQAFESVVHGVAQFVERNRAEASLRESEDRFRTAFEEAPYGMCLTAPDGRFLHANAALCQTLGYTSEELLAGAWQQITHPDDLERSRQVALRFSQGEIATTEFEKRYVHKQGNAIWVRLKISVVKNDSGNPSHYITQIEDITRRKLADQAQAFLASLVESSQDAIAGTTPDGIVVSWNRGAAELYGYTAAEMIGKRASILLVPSDRPDEMPELLTKIRHGERVTGHETVRIRKDGRRVDVSLTISPVFDAAGNVTGAAYIARDISARKIAEERLRASEEGYRELFENASDPVYTFDLDMRITSLNRLAEQTIGYDREEATQMSLRQLVTAEQWQRVEIVIARLVAGHPPAKFEVEIRARDGRRVMLEVNPRLIYRNNKAIGIQGIARDITGRDVAEVELRQAQKLESVGRLASGIAHEINTPMQFVGDNVRFLQDSFAGLQSLIDRLRALCDPSDAPVPPGDFHATDFPVEFRRLEAELDTAYILKEIPDALAHTLDGVDRVVTIVRAMKEFAHPESMGMARSDLNKALLNTLAVARNELKYVAEVETDLGDLPLVVCSMSDLNQVFLNLLVNAAHAIADVVQGSGQQGKIRVRTRTEGPAVLISISDTGAGIPPAIRERIFDPFFTTKEVGRGTGQGLAIARSVIDRHKGNLTFESTVGNGTTFNIRLPIDSTADGSSPAQTPDSGA
jgi:PAS domain S-box-containing protein